MNNPTSEVKSLDQTLGLSEEEKSYLEKKDIEDVYKDIKAKGKNLYAEVMINIHKANSKEKLESAIAAAGLTKEKILKTINDGDIDIGKQYEKTVQRVDSKGRKNDDIALLQALAAECVREITYKNQKNEIIKMLKTTNYFTAANAIDGYMGPNTTLVFSLIAKQELGTNKEGTDVLTFNGEVSKELILKMYKFCNPTFGETSIDTTTQTTTAETKEQTSTEDKEDIIIIPQKEDTTSTEKKETIATEKSTPTETKDKTTETGTKEDIFDIKDQEIIQDKVFDAIEKTNNNDSADDDYLYWKELTDSQKETAKKTYSALKTTHTDKEIEKILDQNNDVIVLGGIKNLFIKKIRMKENTSLEKTKMQNILQKINKRQEELTSPKDEVDEEKVQTSDKEKQADISEKPKEELQETQIEENKTALKEQFAIIKAYELKGIRKEDYDFDDTLTTSTDGQRVLYSIRKGDTKVMDIGLYIGGEDTGCFYVGMDDFIYQKSEKNEVLDGSSIGENLDYLIQDVGEKKLATENITIQNKIHADGIIENEMT